MAAVDTGAFITIRGVAVEAWKLLKEGAYLAGIMRTAVWFICDRKHSADNEIAADGLNKNKGTPFAANSRSRGKNQNTHREKKAITP